MMKQLRVGRRQHNYTHPTRPRYASPHSAREVRHFHGQLKVITYNIKLSKRVEKAAHLLGDHEDLSGADIICLQEMDPAGVKHIAHELDYNYVYYPAILHPRSSKDFGNAILSKWPIVSDQKIILPKVGTGRLQRIAVYATLRIGHFKVAVVSLHMKIYATPKQRRVPIDHILKTIDHTHDHCIIAGDFNTFTKAQRKSISAPFYEGGFTHVTGRVGSTYKYWYLLNKEASLDHIFVKGMTILHAGKVTNRKASDHIPIWSELRLASRS